MWAPAGDEGRRGYPHQLPPLTHNRHSPNPSCPPSSPRTPMRGRYPLPFRRTGETRYPRWTGGGAGPHPSHIHATPARGSLPRTRYGVTLHSQSLSFSSRPFLSSSSRPFLSSSSAAKDPPPFVPNRHSPNPSCRTPIRYPRWGMGGAATDATPLRNRSGIYLAPSKPGQPASRVRSATGPFVVQSDEGLIRRFISSVPKNSVYETPAATAPRTGPTQ